MAKADSNRSSAETERRKPHPDFPLTWNRAARYWVKKIRGVVHRFGPRDCDPQTALDEWLRVKDDLLAGRKPRDANSDGTTVKLLCDSFLTDRSHRMEAGELATSSFNDYLKTCRRLADHFGRGRVVSDLRADDFLELRAKLAAGRSPTTLANEIQRVRVVFNFAYQTELVDKPLRMGPTFRRPSKKTLRLHRQSQEAKLFTSQEIRDLLNVASIELAAMILLGINAALGNRDVAKLTFKHLRDDWLTYPRPKTGVERKAKLWPETIAAIERVKQSRRAPQNEKHSDLVFVTKYRGPWYSEANKDCPIAKEMRKLLDKIGINRRGVGFYALRHTFKTVADETKDFAAVEHVMGHEGDVIASMYREGICDDRLSAVADFVRAWLFGGEVQS